MNDACWKITRLGKVIVVALVAFGTSAYAETVLKDFYDAALGDADPVTQGWTKTLFDLNGVSSLTPDPDNDRVHMVASGLGTVNYARKQLLTEEQEIVDAISDDFYAWEVEMAVKTPEAADADGEARHGISDMNFITGTRSGSVGFRDRFTLETTDRPIDAPVERIRMTGSWFPSAGFSGTIRPHTATDPQTWTNFTSVYDRNVYRFERHGLGLGTAKFFINGDLVFQGAGGINSQSATEATLWQSCTRVGVPECIMNQYWYRFSFEVEPGTGGMACDFNSDSSCDYVDIDLLANAVRNGTSDSQFNVDGLGDPNIPDDADFDFYITDESMLSTGFGDHDLDFNVNFVDFVRLSNNFGISPTGWGQGNGNTDDITNFNDFVRLSNNFGENFASGSNVPEPAALVVLGLGVLATFRRLG